MSSSERPPICPACGVTMVPADLSARGARDRDWVCLECEETDEPDEADARPVAPESLGPTDMPLLRQLQNPPEALNRLPGFWLSTSPDNRTKGHRFLQDRVLSYWNGLPP